MKRISLLWLLTLSACNGDMVVQPRQDSYDRSELFADGTGMKPPPNGVIAQDQVAQSPPRPIDMARLRRGHARYGIYCAPCHGLDGRAGGTVVARGFPAPQSFLDTGLDLSEDHVASVIDRGQGLMYGFSDRVGPDDQRAIAAYVRALVLSQKGAPNHGA